jgi:hypothetical protein
MIGGTYSYADGKVSITMMEPERQAEPVEYGVRFTADGMEQTPASGEVRRLRRHPERAVEAPGEPAESKSIVGVWSWPHYTGRRAYEAFREDGTWSFRLPMVPGCTEGSWKRADRDVTFQWPEGEPSVYSIEDGDPRVLRGSNGNWVYEGPALWHPIVSGP